MTKQEFLAMSLPFHLKVLVDTSHWFEKREPFIAELEGLFNFESYTVKYLDKSGASYTDNGMRFKPILHPLSDLTKEIEHNGEKFIPITKLNELFGYKEIRMVHYINSGLGWQLDPSHSPSAISFGNMINPILKLVEWHFDIAELIEKGEAIDVNTLPENPYK